MFANHGALVKHHHEIEGVNSRLDGLQAAILSVKLKHIKAWNKSRFENALLYNKLLVTKYSNSKDIKRCEPCISFICN